MNKRSYAAYIKELTKSNSKRLQFNFFEKEEARQCLRSARDCIERNGYELSAWRVKNVVYVEKI